MERRRTHTDHKHVFICVSFIHTYTSDKYEKTIKKYAKAAGTAIGDFGQCVVSTSLNAKQ